MANKFKKKDQVIVIAGKSKGHIGHIERVFADDYLIVTGANMKKKHIKADPQNNKPGEIKSVEGRIHQSNVALYDADKKSRIKVAFKLNEQNVKQRVNKETGDPI